MRSRWLLPGAAFAITLSWMSIADWPEHLPATPVNWLAALSANAALAFGLALLFELVQALRARFVRFSGLFSLGLLVFALTFSWCVGSELVRAVQRLAAVGIVHVIAFSLASGLVVALFGLRSNGFGLNGSPGSLGQKLAFFSNVVLLVVLLWAQRRYSMQLREAKFSSVSAAFLVLAGVAFLRVVERLRPIQSNWRGVAVVASLLAISVAGFAWSPDQALRQQYFAGLFPGRILFGIHLPELLLHRAARSARQSRFLDAASAQAQPTDSAVPRVARTDARADVVLFILVDTLRADVFQRYLQDPSSKLHGAYRESCLASTLYSPSSNTSGTLSKLLWQPLAAGDRWLDRAKRAGVDLSIVLDVELEPILDRLPNKVVTLFDQVVRVPRQRDGAVAPLAPAVRPLLAAPGPQLIWAHFYDVHEWDHDDPGVDAQRYYETVERVGSQIADLISDISQSTRRVSVIVTSDHGEGLDHYSTRHHGEYVYEPLVRVPLLLWTHGYACPQSVAALRGKPASATLLGRLTLDELGIAAAASAPSLEGLAMQPILIHASMQDAIVRWPHKLIVSPWFTELFDLSLDPNELDDLSDSSSALVHELRDLLEDETGVF